MPRNVAVLPLVYSLLSSSYDQSRFRRVQCLCTFRRDGSADLLIDVHRDTGQILGSYLVVPHYLPNHLIDPGFSVCEVLVLWVVMALPVLYPCSYMRIYDSLLWRELLYQLAQFIRSKLHSELLPHSRCILSCTSEIAVQYFIYSHPSRLLHAVENFVATPTDSHLFLHIRYGQVRITRMGGLLDYICRPCGIYRCKWEGHISGGDSQIMHVGKDRRSTRTYRPRCGVLDMTNRKIIQVGMEE
jgi:hypothetical protein